MLQNARGPPQPLMATHVPPPGQPQPLMATSVPPPRQPQPLMNPMFQQRPPGPPTRPPLPPMPAPPQASWNQPPAGGQLINPLFQQRPPLPPMPRPPIPCHSRGSGGGEISENDISDFMNQWCDDGPSNHPSMQRRQEARPPPQAQPSFSSALAKLRAKKAGRMQQRLPSEDFNPAPMDLEDENDQEMSELSGYSSFYRESRNKRSGDPDFHENPGKRFRQMNDIASRRIPNVRDMTPFEEQQFSERSSGFMSDLSHEEPVRKSFFSSKVDFEYNEQKENRWMAILDRDWPRRLRDLDFEMQVRISRFYFNHFETRFEYF